jgi:beta-galactosidase/beta-glucuronidase
MLPKSPPKPITMVNVCVIELGPIHNSIGTLDYVIDVQGDHATDVIVTMFDEQNAAVGQHIGASGSIRVNNVQLWWPRGMGAAYLYTVKVGYHL